MNKRIALFSLVTLLSIGCIAQADDITTALKKTVRSISKALPAHWEKTAPVAVLELAPNTAIATVNWAELAQSYGAVITTDDALAQDALDLGLDVYDADVDGKHTNVVILNSDVHSAMVSWIESFQ